MAILEDLVVHQLASQLRDHVMSLTSVPTASREFRLKDQLRDAASSVVANIAEGYGRSQHKDFARFLDIACGSLREAEEWIKDGIVRQAWTRAQADTALHLCIRLTPALTRLKRYLRNTKTPSF